LNIRKRISEKEISEKKISEKKNILLENLFIYNTRNNISKDTGFMELQKQDALPEGIKTNKLKADKQK
jgi:hypothetical protein